VKAKTANLTVVVLMAAIVAADPAVALDESTHEIVNEQATRRSLLDQRLKTELGLLKGIEESIDERTVFQWLREGGSHEDSPHCRSARHFHDPLQPWETAGLHTFNPIIAVPCVGFSFASSIHWAQDPHQTIGEKAAWQDARRSYLRALTEPAPGDRAAAFADTFRVLGQQMHLVADASVPEHVRNDPHILESMLRAVGLTGYGSYEYWVSDQHRDPDAERTFVETYLSNPFPVDAALLSQPTNHAQAPAAIARLIDGDTYRGLETGPNVTRSPAIGIAEFANANFFSEDTAGGQYPYPNLETLVRSQHPAPKSGRVRAYYRKAQDDGEPVDPVLAECVLDEAAQSEAVLIPRTYGCVDENVWTQTARHLLPRAVGYAQGVLDYFFRGSLDGDVVPDPADPSVVRFSGTNASRDALDGGTLELYGEDPKGKRTRLAALEPDVRVTAGPGAAVQSAGFQPSPDAERYVAVYKGPLGHEVPAGDSTAPASFPGAVIGKVLGGVRAEQVYRDDTRWNIRTPQDVFALPLKVAEFEEVTWGDDEDVLVARTRFGPDQPNRVATFRVPRTSGTKDIATAADGAALALTPGPAAVFPFGMALGTTVRLLETFEFKQHIGIHDPWKVVFKEKDRWWELINPGVIYLFDHNEISPLVVTDRQQTVPFDVSVPIVLDLEHNWDFGTADGPYTWQLREVAASPGGQLLGLVVVYLTSPGVPGVAIPVLDVNPFTRTIEPVTEHLVRPSFPDEVNPLLWALVDLGTGTVVAKTAADTVTITSRRVVEVEPRIWAHVVQEKADGFLAGDITDLGWTGFALSPKHSRLPSTAASRGADVRQLTVDGWLTGEVRTELRTHGLADFAVTSEAVTNEYTYGCSGALGGGECPPPQTHVYEWSEGRVVAQPVRLAEARRARPAPGGERLVVLAAGKTGGFSETGHVVVWDPGVRAQVLAQFRRGFHRLGAATARAVLVDADEILPRQVTSFVIPLDGPQGPVPFPNESLTGAFTLLEPSALYSVDALRFFRLRSPLQPTALPALLKEVPGNPSGDVHAIRLP
jgi:hypothetical protein